MRGNQSSNIESEKSLERKLSKGVEKLGGLYFKLPAVYVAGLPDRLCLLPGGVVFFAEIKTTGKKVSKIQKLMHNKIKRIGFKVYIIESSQNIKDIITGYE